MKIGIFRTNILFGCLEPGSGGTEVVRWEIPGAFASRTDGCPRDKSNGLASRFSE